MLHHGRKYSAIAEKKMIAMTDNRDLMLLNVPCIFNVVVVGLVRIRKKL